VASWRASLRRQRHGFATAPNSRILRALLAMASSPAVAAAAALDAATGLAAQELSGPRADAVQTPAAVSQPFSPGHTLQASESAGAVQKPAAAGKTPNPNLAQKLSTPAGMASDDATALERALEAANVVVDAVDFAREQLDAADAAAAAAATATRRSENLQGAVGSSITMPWPPAPISASPEERMRADARVVGAGLVRIAK